MLVSVDLLPMPNLALPQAKSRRKPIDGSYGFDGGTVFLLDIAMAFIAGS
jgi:hypothetical protein